MFSLKRQYNVGDKCWISVGYTDDEDRPTLSEGRVVHRFTLEHHPNKEFYVIESKEHELFPLQVRDVYLMTHEEGKNLPVMRL